MLVNNVDISTYKAKLLTKNIQTAEVTIYDDWLRNALNPLYLGRQETFKSIRLQMLISDTTDNLCLTDISDLVSQLEKCTIKFNDVDFYYDCTLVSKEHTRLITAGYFGLEVELKSGYAYLAEVTENMDNMLSKEITVLGNLPSPAKITITADIGTISVTLSGFGGDITINDLTANVPIVIDGELGTILQNGSNKFGDVELWNFPFLQPGVRTISIDSEDCKISIKYKPKFI